MYLTIIICSILFTRINARHSPRVSLLPLSRHGVAARLPSRSSLATAGCIQFERNGIATFIHPEAEATSALSSWPGDTYQKRQQLYRRSLNGITGCESIEELISVIRRIQDEVKGLLFPYFNVPIARFFLQEEVYAYLSAFHDLMHVKCRECTKDARIRLLDASPRLRRRYMFLLKELETAYMDVVSSFRRLAIKVRALPFDKAHVGTGKDTDYWSSVHLRAYKNGAKLLLKAVLLAMLNRFILPILLKQTLSLLAKHYNCPTVNWISQLVAFNIQ
ncbi:hypothetical protein BgAZ_107080 [Babesia gibsoni]|uniref:Uncharacterized protein n=1 Tax=Babesia gibsoni TaxID=33632 RepID=A0AAD8PGI6_BABGI|nr:hypothetical protein BgAZ_107080 [Babesia gibsoni]